MRTERQKVGPQRPFARPLHQPSSKMAWSVGAASSASKNRRLTDLQDGAQRASAGWGLVRNGGGGEGGWQRFVTRLWRVPKHLMWMIMSSARAEN